MIDEDKFWDLINTWEHDTLFDSSSTKILTHPAVHALISMGPEVIPLTLRALKNNFHLAYVLHKLTGEWPVKDEYAGNSGKIILCWLEWAQKHGYKTEAPAKSAGKR